MYGDVFLMERNGQPARRASRLPLGDTRGRDEAWLRDILFAHPEVLPVADIDPSFAPLLPLCRELRTEAGSLDLAFVTADGKLTLVECKLWRNPESRRKVVAQILDYARAMSRWTYSDLQRQVSVATGRQGNLPFEQASRQDPLLQEHHFADAVTRNMRAGRFLLLIAGDGIREDVGALAELVNRNAASGFAFGLVEIALYDLGDEGLAVQPRVTARTHLIERTVVVVRDADRALASDGGESWLSGGDAGGSEGQDIARREGESPKQAEYRRWWQPVLEMTFDDPDQDPPRLYWPNHVRAQLPWPGTWVTAYRSAPRSGVFLSGRTSELDALWPEIEAMLDDIMAELPEGSEAGHIRSSGDRGIGIFRENASFADDGEMRDWLKATLNAYVNALRPRLKHLAS